MKHQTPPPAKARKALRTILGPVLALLLIMGGAAPAYADVNATDGGLGFGLGLGFGNTAGTMTVSPTDSWALVDSGFDLNQVDVLTGTLAGNDMTMAMTQDYSVVTMMDQSAQMAFDTQLLAQQALKEAEAKRQASLGTGNGKLKPGSVPSPYDQILENNIGRCPGLPLGIVAAQIAAESNWNPKARSGVGAAGIAQFMPGTWKSYGVDGNGDGVKDILNPEDAIPAAIEYDCMLLDSVKNDSTLQGDPISLMLASYNAGLGNVRKYDGIPPFQETRNYVAKITANAANYATSDQGGQTSVTADGCPSSAPANTLRDGAQSIGVAQICARSVAQARTPEAAGAIKFMLKNLGTPYSQPRRNSAGYFDCSSYVSAGYRAGGSTRIYPAGSNAQTTASLRGAQGKWTFSVPYAQAVPGDLIFPSAGHVGLVLADGWMVHTNRTGDVSHVKKKYSAGGTFLVLRVDPSRI